jgi:hypothetical protein
MNKKQPKENLIVSWEHLPGAATIFQYLGRADLIELSICCKRYRNQLERNILETLDISTWIINNKEIYKELRDSKNYIVILEYLKTDLGSKLKYAEKFALNCYFDCQFVEIFVNLLPNIKTLRLYDIYNQDYSQSSHWEKSLVALLKSMYFLEHVILEDYWEWTINNCDIKQIFSKSLKSLIIYSDYYYEDDYDSLRIFDTIDISYANLCSLSIVSNKMLQNLSSGISSLQEVWIEDIFNLNSCKFVKFLKANPQLSKITTNLNEYSEEILINILSLKYLEYWNIINGNWEELEINGLPLNYSIKYLSISSYEMPASLSLKFINSCKVLETLEPGHSFNKVDLSKLEHRINKLKISCSYFIDNSIEIDVSRLFNQICFKRYCSIEELFDKYKIDKFVNYKLVPSISNSCTLKLID